MLIELVGTVFAGLGGAGVVLWLRLLTSSRLPKWMIPVAAGVAMLAFQIVNEYNWYPSQLANLPDGVEVVSQVEVRSWWRPWTWMVPQTSRLIIADFAGAEQNQINPALHKVNLYALARRQSIVHMITVVHCESRARADYHTALDTPRPGDTLSSEWIALADDDRLLKVCP
jgi:hypothetical protein